MPVKVDKNNAAVLSEEGAEEDQEKTKNESLQKIKIKAYTGGKMRVDGWDYPVVVDLSRLDIGDGRIPIVRDHCTWDSIGYTTELTISGKSLESVAMLMRSTEQARKVIDHMNDGYPWRASIAVEVDDAVFVEDGDSMKVNGAVHNGPFYVINSGRLKEISIVVVAADMGTNVSLAASGLRLLNGAGVNLMRSKVNKNVADDTHSDAAEGGEKQSTKTSATTKIDVLASSIVSGNDDKNQTIETRREKQIRAIEKEKKRIEKIEALFCGEKSDLCSRAISEGWSAVKTELIKMREDRSRIAPAIHVADRSVDQGVLTACAAKSCGISEKTIRQKVDEKTLEKADRLGAIGLRELMAECCRLDGITVPHRYGVNRDMIRAGFSTMMFNTVMTNTANAIVLDSYESVDLFAETVCSEKTVNDYKKVSLYRPSGTGAFERVAKTGKVKHGIIDRSEYENKADQWAQLVTITDVDIINDDIDFFVKALEQIGRNAALTIDTEFFSLLIDGTDNFFTTGNGNLLTGADSAFGSESLSKARALMRKQKDGPGNRKKDQMLLNLVPRDLLVPAEMEHAAASLIGSENLLLDGAQTATVFATKNFHYNKYRVSGSASLSDEKHTNYSTTAWYIFSDPKASAAFSIVRLNNEERPVVEQRELGPDTLGVGFLTRYSFGVSMQDHRGAVKSTGV